MKKNLNEEQSYLDKTILRFKETHDESNLALKNYYKDYNQNPLMYGSLIENTRNKINSINKSIDKPYFGRIDFNDSNEETECYISKVGIFDSENNPITIDWRAPIASLYYDGNIGDVSYIAPEGLIKGRLTLKRQYEITDNQVKSFMDIDTVTNDELLKPYLSCNNDNRLKNIVSTIQAEQNAIIRKSINNNMIIQGVAGSGKTTVALHRIAFLEYNYREKYKSTDYLVIGPNKYFVKYISGVLPDLDIYDTPQTTFDELFQSIIKNKLHFKNDNLSRAIIGDNLSNEKYKLSLEFKNEIDDYLKEYLDNYIVEDFYVNNYLILKKEVIKSFYLKSKNYEVFSDKIKKVILDITGYIKQNYNTIQSDLLINCKDYKSIQKALKNYFQKELRDYFNIKSINIINMYKDITHESVFETEDYPGILYLYYRIFGINNYNHIRHTVIDEAQDYGIFNFYILKKILPNSTFSIYGDLAQSLYSFHSIESWEELYKVFPEIEINYLNKSYRTTIEILNYANKVNKYLGLNEAIPVIRHGKDVNVQKYSKEVLLDILKEYHNKYHSQIAIIIKSDIEYEEVKSIIKGLDYDINIITSYNVKGLEFDCTIIYNADNSCYDFNNKLDMKLLYVSLTRALHEMTVLYKNDICPILTK